MKKRTNHKEAAKRANARARDAKSRATAGAVVGVGASIVGAMLAPMAAEYLPGPSAEKLAEWGKKKPGAATPLKSPRVLLPLGLGLAVAAFGGDGIVARATAYTAGGMACTFYQATAAELGTVDSAALAVEVKKK